MLRRAVEGIYLEHAPRVRARMKLQGQAQRVLEVVREHRELAPVGEAVRVERDEDARHDREEPERGPEARERDDRVDRLPRARRVEPVDDAAEEDRLGERGDGEEHVGDGQPDAEPPLGPELPEDASVEAQQLHGRTAPTIAAPRFPEVARVPGARVNAAASGRTAAGARRGPCPSRRSTPRPSAACRGACTRRPGDGR